MTNPKHADQALKMLLVEDEPVLLSALQKFFTQEGFQVDCARELEEAEAMIATSHYAIVIADLTLNWTAVEGLEILRCVRQESRGTRVIILTGNATPGMQTSAAMLGAEAFFYKPMPLPVIAETVHRLTGGAR